MLSWFSAAVASIPVPPSAPQPLGEVNRALAPPTVIVSKPKNLLEPISEVDEKSTEDVIYDDPSQVPPGMEAELVEVITETDASVWGFFNYMVSGSGEINDKEIVTSEVKTASSIAVPSVSFPVVRPVIEPPQQIPVAPQIKMTDVGPLVSVPVAEVLGKPQLEANTQDIPATVSPSIQVGVAELPSFASAFTNNEFTIDSFIQHSESEPSEEGLELLDSPRPANETLESFIDHIAVELEETPSPDRSVDKAFIASSDILQGSWDHRRSVEGYVGKVFTRVPDTTVCSTCGHHRRRGSVDDFFCDARRRLRSI